jgi:hypothetical protein
LDSDVPTLLEKSILVTEASGRQRLHGRAVIVILIVLSSTNLSLDGRPHRAVSFRLRRSLSLIISVISAAGRISIVPHFNFTPGDWEMS